MYDTNDTIAAISTVDGSGGIAVIRISGSEAIAIADRIYHGRKPLSDTSSNMAVVGNIYSPDYFNESNQLALDEVVVVVFRSPKSYTKEDVVEISCHGGRFLVKKIFSHILSAGARMARPGEFTQRAYCNGRFDLAQAESVAEIISAKTQIGLTNAMLHYQGDFSKRIDGLRSQLISSISMLELELDFSDEDVVFANREQLCKSLAAIESTIQSLVVGYQRGKALRDGVKIVLVGKPNVGKSSLLNTFLNEERVIVTDIPGTTRDVIEEQIDIKGVYFRIVDTAGIRKAGDIVEQIGVERAYEQIDDCDLVLLLFDGSEKLDEGDSFFVREIRKRLNSSQQVIPVINKLDKPQVLTGQDLISNFELFDALEVSLKSMLNFDKLESRLLERSGFSEGLQEPVITNIRHKISLEKSLVCISTALQSLKSGLSSEFVSADLKIAFENLGEIIGEVTSEDILDHIFSEFCIGK